MLRRHTVAEVEEFGGGESAQVFARDQRTGELVFLARGAADAMRATAVEHFTCPIPGCDAPRPLSTRGQSKRDHFFHRTPHSHPGGLESLNHFQAKHVLADWASAAGVDVQVNEEEWSPDIRRRADVMVTWSDGRQLAIEVEYKNYRAIDWRTKNSDYLSRKITPLWVFGHTPARYLRRDSRAAFARPPGEPTGYRLVQLTTAVIEAGQPVLIINPALRKVGTLWLNGTRLEDARADRRWWARRTVVGSPATPAPDLAASVELAVCDLDDCTLDPDRGMVTPALVAISKETARVASATKTDRDAWEADEAKDRRARLASRARSRTNLWRPDPVRTTGSGPVCRKCGTALDPILAGSGFHILCRPRQAI